MRKRCVLLRAVILAILTACSATAQVLSGSIVGQVLDTSNAGVSAASVRITHRETNQSRSTVTSAYGEYAFQSLPGGAYDIVISKEGFQTFKADSVALTVGQVARVDASLRVGQVSETVSVSRRRQQPCRPTAPKSAAEVTATQLENLPTPAGPQLREPPRSPFPDSLRRRTTTPSPSTRRAA